MKIYPTKHIKKAAEDEDKVLTTAEKITRIIALFVAFVTVYYFFVKILFL